MNRATRNGEDSYRATAHGPLAPPRGNMHAGMGRTKSSQRGGSPSRRVSRGAQSSEGQPRAELPARAQRAHAESVPDSQEPSGLALIAPHERTAAVESAPGGDERVVEGKGKETDSSGEGEDDEEEDEEDEHSFEDYSSPPSPRFSMGMRKRLLSSRGLESRASLFNEDDPYGWTDGGDRDVIWQPNSVLNINEEDNGGFSASQRSSQMSTPTSKKTVVATSSSSARDSSFYALSKMEGEGKELKLPISSASSASSSVSSLPLATRLSSSSISSLSMRSSRSVSLRNSLGLLERTSLSTFKSRLINQLSSTERSTKPESKQPVEKLLLMLERLENTVSSMQAISPSGDELRRLESTANNEDNRKGEPVEGHLGLDDMWIDMLSDEEFTSLIQQAEEMNAMKRSSGDISSSSSSAAPVKSFSEDLSLSTSSASSHSPMPASFTRSPDPSVLPVSPVSLSDGRKLSSHNAASGETEESEQPPKSVSICSHHESISKKRSVDDDELTGTQRMPIMIDDDSSGEERNKKRKREREAIPSSQSSSQLIRNLSLSRLPSTQPGKLSLRKRRLFHESQLPLAQNPDAEMLKSNEPGENEEPAASIAPPLPEKDSHHKHCDERKGENSKPILSVETITKITLAGTDEDEIQIVEQSQKVIMEGMREMDKEAFLEDLDKNGWWEEAEQLITRPLEDTSHSHSIVMETDPRDKGKDKEEHHDEKRRSEMEIADDYIPPDIGELPNPALEDQPEFTAEMFDLAMQQAYVPQMGYTVPKRKLYERFLVLEVSVNEYEQSAPGESWVTRAPEKVLRLFDEVHSAEKFAHLRTTWQLTEVNPGDYVHIVGTFDEQNRCVINQEQNILILHPDMLVTGTTVGDSFFCLRKAILNRKAKLSDRSMPLIKGTILHDSFETALITTDFSTEALATTIREKMASKLDDIYAVSETDTTARDKLESAIPNMQRWAEKYLHSRPQSEIVLDKERKKVCVSKILAIEENIWSPAFGLKGKIDASVEIKVDHYGCTTETLALPLELKTGKQPRYDANHKAQLTLYTLLMSDRYDTNIRSGLLYYVESGEMHGIRINRSDLVPIIQRRNEIASHLVQKTIKLPDMKRNLNSCKHCHQIRTCTLYHKAIENGTRESSGLGNLFDELTTHLKPAHINYFQTWDRLIDMEEAEMYKHREEIWLMNGEERELRTGRCFNDMVVDKRVETEKGFLYCFKRAALREWEREKERSSSLTDTSGRPKSASLPPSLSSLLDLAISAGDYLIISTVGGDFGVATGFIKELTSTCVYVQMDEELRPPPAPLIAENGPNSQVFHGLVEIEDLVPNPATRKLADRPPRASGSLSVQHTRSSSPSIFDVRWRLDKEELSSGFALVKQNLLHLFIAQGDEKRRRLIVDLEPPAFVSSHSLSQSLSQRKSGLIKAEPADKSAKSLVGLNADQEMAIEKVLQAQDYALILGMPGTGKTTTIARVVQALFALNKTILLTAYTHTAVDNLLLKLLDIGVEFLRLGKPDSIHPKIQPYAFYNGKGPGGKEVKSVAEVADLFSSAQIVATTCLSMNHALFTKRKFDYCIVDEASQITLPVCLGPIRFSDVFVLVGDHYQLPPLVLNAEAKELGMGVSLFKRLSEAHPQSVVNLEHQYRMNADIMMLCNHLTYGYRLRCGNQDVASRTLRNQLQHLDRLPEPLVYGVRTSDSGSCESPLAGSRSSKGSMREKEAIYSLDWLRQAIDPQRTVIFLDTDSVPAPESRASDDGNTGVLSNQIEAQLVHRITDALLLCGLDAADLGIISPYRAQLKLIRSRLSKINDVTGNAIEIHTVDKYQGRDKDCIIVSLVRSNAENKVGELLRDWRRVNVAFTRAKKKLIILGSLSTLEDNHLFSVFIKLLRENDWIYTLPRDAAQVYGPESHFLRWWRREHGSSTQPKVGPSLPSSLAASPAASSGRSWASPGRPNRARPPARLQRQNSSSSSSSSASSSALVSAAVKISK